MATLTIRRLDEVDRDWLRRVSQSEGISMEEYVRRMVRTARLDTRRTFGDVLDEINGSLDDETRDLLGDPPPIERPAPRARDIIPRDDDDVPARAAP